MSLAPRNAAEYIAWVQAHAEAFVSNATVIGVPSGTATSFQAAADALSKTISDQVAAQDAARAATATLNEAISDNRRALADIVRMVRVKAASSTDPTAIFNAAGLPVPAAPTPVAPPGTPRDFVVGISTTNGAVELKWKCQNPVNGPGTVYMVEREVNNGARQFCGLAGGEKSYTDATLPIGTDRVSYFVTGQRSGVRGVTAEVSVRFGTIGGNATATFVEVPSQSKMAA